jgi:subtilase family serine protease
MSRSGLVWLGAALLHSALVPGLVTAIQKPGPQDGVRPDFDIRLAPRQPSTPSAAVRAALDRLERQTGRALRPRTHPVTGAVRVLTADGHPLSEASGDPPAAVARRFVAANNDLLGLNPSEISTLTLLREYSSHNERLTHVVFDQIVDGITVFEGVVALHIDSSGAVRWLSSSASSTAGRQPPRLSAESAVSAAALDIRPETAFVPNARTAPEGPARATVFDRGPFKRDVEARLVYFPVGARLEPAWLVFIEPEGFPQAYDVIVSARDGSLLYRRNRYQYADGSGRVLQSAATQFLDPRRPDPRPLGLAPGCPPVANHLVRSLNTPFRDPATVLFDGGRLAGNNVHVFRGSVGTEGALGVFDVNVWSFDFAYNTAASAESTLFFAVNFAHDFYYDLGFDEAAGNFQVGNFGRGGIGGDSLNANARAPGRNNANIAVPADGESPTMNMFLFDGYPCWGADVDGDGSSDVDASLDLDIVLHEYHHGITFRVNPDWSGNEAGAIGEGGGDFFAYSVNEDVVLGEYSLSGGIRRVNAKTYADWYCFYGLICFVHDNGEIFANVLWDLRERFRHDLVGATEAAAVREVHQLYVDALKLSPPGPTMLDLRDAILAADNVRNPDVGTPSSLNYCRIWTAFSGRGMGVNAADTVSTGNNHVVADFTLPAICPAPAPPPQLSVSVTAPTAAEAGATNGGMTITRTGNTASSLVVSYLVGGTATAGSDYVPLPGTAVIPAGAASALLQIVPIDDVALESNETVTVTLQSMGPNYTLGSSSAGTVSILSEDVLPDLVLTALTLPSAAAAGSTVIATDTTANQDQGDARVTMTRFYLSSNTSIDAADPGIGGRSVPVLATGGSSSGSTTLTIPADTPAGSYYVIASADGDKTETETKEYNNTRLAIFRVGPDLVVSALTGPSRADGGASVVVTDTVRNQDPGAAGPSTTTFYYSVDAVLDAGDVAMTGTRAVGDLASGQSSTGSTTVTIPSGATVGTRYIIAKADGAQAVPESQEKNNTRAASILIGPDLTLSSLIVPARGGSGTSITVTDTTHNQGASGSGPSTTRFYLSKDYSLDAADVLLDGSRSVPGLASGSTSSGPTVVTIPAGTVPGTYSIFAKADADSAIAETSEYNNARSASIQIGPDLTLSSLVAPTRGGAGLSITVTDTVTNQGVGASAESTTRFYLSNDYSLSTSDLLLDGSRTVPGLDTGGTNSGSTVVTIPSSVAPGSYILFAKADGSGVVVETSESNNTRWATLQIGPDLILTTMTIPSSVVAGTVVTISDTLKNQGGGGSGASVIRYYLSTNFTLDVSDTLLDGVRASASLAPGASDAGSVSVTMPAGIAPGAYYVIAKADADAQVGETSEGNNTIFRSTQVKAPTQ